MEVWKDVIGYEGRYEISNYGRVKSLVCWQGNDYINRELILKSCSKGDGYTRVALSKSNIIKTFLVSRLVAYAFIPNPNNKPQVNHISGIKTDNNVRNLEWCTKSENMQHAWDNNLMPKKLGEAHHSTKLKEIDVIAIRKLRIFFTQKELSIMFNTTISNIKNIDSRRTWKHI